MKIRNSLILLLTATIWGFAFVAQSVGMDYVGPLTFLFSRSLIGGIVLLPVVAILHKNGPGHASETPEEKRKARKTLLIGGVCCGVALAVSEVLQQFGLARTSVGKAGFLTALYVVIVPVLGLLAGRRPGARLWVCVAVSVAGLYLLCLAGRDTLTLTGGEWQLLLCALLFAVQILLVGHFGPQLDGVQLSFVEFLVTALLSTGGMLLFEQPTVEQLAGAAVAIAYCGILSSGVGYTLQIVGQQNLDPTIASMAMCLESVFSALAGWLLLRQTMSAPELAGCALMFAAIVGAQLPEREKAQRE